MVYKGEINYDDINYLQRVLEPKEVSKRRLPTIRLRHFVHYGSKSETEERFIACTHCGFAVGGPIFRRRQARHLLRCREFGKRSFTNEYPRLLWDSKYKKTWLQKRSVEWLQYRGDERDLISDEEDEGNEEDEDEDEDSSSANPASTQQDYYDSLENLENLLDKQYSPNSLPESALWSVQQRHFYTSEEGDEWE